MALSEEAKLYIRKAFGDEQELEKTDPEFYEFFSNFAYGEVRGALSLDEKTAHMSQLAVLLGCGVVDGKEVVMQVKPGGRWSIRQ